VIATGSFRPDQVYLGWQQTLAGADPGPPPNRPAPPDPDAVDMGWERAQRQEEIRLSGPFWIAGASCLVAGGAAAALGWAGLLTPALAGLAAAAGLGLAMPSAREIWRGRRVLAATLSAERARVEAVRAGQRSVLARQQEEYARSLREWQARREASSHEPQWTPVSVPDDIDRVDVVGGTLAGWAALLTTICAARLASGGEVTVVDLSPGPAALDLVTLAGAMGHRPLVWVLPADLPQLDLGLGMPARALADVLAASAAADDAGDAGPGPARDRAIIDHVLRVLGDGASVAAVNAALRALGQIGDPRADIGRGVLTDAQYERLSGLFGKGAADRVVTERAWALEGVLSVLDPLGTGQTRLAHSNVRVIAVDPRVGGPADRVMATFVAVALTHLLRTLAPGPPWRHTLCVAGAERLRDDVLDRLCDACEVTGTGLVLAFRSVPARVRARIGRGNAATAFMRLGNAEEARAASEQIGSEHRFVLSQLTDTVGSSVTGTLSASYTRTVGTADSLSSSVSQSQSLGHSRGRGHSRADLAPFAPRTGSGHREVSSSVATSDSVSWSESISANTSWGISTAEAVAASESLAATGARSRELLVEPHHLQQLPPSAVILSYAGPDGRRVVLADANPGIGALPTAAPMSPQQPGRAG
jgi:hypothetical protein